jgi:hypothetical protein
MLEHARTAPTHAGEERLQASLALRPDREGRKPPVECEGPKADGRGTGRVHDERGAKRSGCVSVGICQIDPTASAHQETSEPRHRLTCSGCASLWMPADRRARAQRWWLKPFRAGRKVWSGQAVKNSKRAKLVGSPSGSGPIVDRCGFFSLGPLPDIVMPIPRATGARHARSRP